MKTRIGSVVALMLAFSVLSYAWQNVASSGRGDFPAPPHQPRPALTVSNGMSGMTSGELASVPDVIAGFEGEDQDDPSYTLYKAGYKLVLDEKWAEARRKFSEVLSKYPKSKYSAEAQYWMAYSWKYSDKKKAVESYKSFLKQYPTSNYYDDALGDLGRLENPVVPVVPRPDRFSGYAVGITKGAIARSYALAESAAAVYSGALATAGTLMPAREYGGYPDEKKEDPELTLKVEAFQALIRSGKDERAFGLVKETLIDPKQPYRMREAALFALGDFERKAKVAHAMSRDPEQSPMMRETAQRMTKAYDTLDLPGFYLEVMKNDTSKWLARNILYHLGYYAERGDERIITHLKQVALDGKQPRDMREAAMHALHSAKRPDMLEVFAQIARKDADVRLRQAAVYQIGQAAKADEDVAFKLLKEYAVDRNQDREIREAALSSLRSLQGNKAAALYLDVAKTDPDEHMQQIALYYFVDASKGQQDKVFIVLRDILQDRSRSWSIRETAMNQIARSNHEDALNLLVSMAKSDPEERIRMTAINYIGSMGKNKSKSLGTLTSLFETLPKDQHQSVQGLMYAIASIGNDEAVDFLGKLAKTHENHEIRRMAIQFLGNIGGEKARTVLVDILKGK